MDTQKTWRQRFTDLIFDLRHPWNTFSREIAVRYCVRNGLMFTPAKEVR